MNEHAFGFTVFCDDIRQEMDGKLSLIGTYRGAIFVHGNFPFIFPKFGMVVSYMEMPGHFSRDVELRVYVPGDREDAPSIRSMLSRAEMQKIQLEEGDKIPGEPQFLRCDAPMLFAPFTIQSAGFIKVRAVCGDEEIRLGTVRVTEQPRHPVSNPNLQSG